MDIGSWRHGSMSLGIGAIANKIREDEEFIVYEYGGYNLNNPIYTNDNRIMDGYITVCKSCFVEPEIHKKIKKRPSGRKVTVIKRVLKTVDYNSLIKEGNIVIVNCCNCWKTTDDGFDINALSIIDKLFDTYQKEGVICNEIRFFK